MCVLRGHEDDDTQIGLNSLFFNRKSERNYFRITLTPEPGLTAVYLIQ